MDILKLYEKSRPIAMKVSFRDQDSRTALHWHSDIELLFFLESGAKVICDQDTYYPKAKEMIIVNSNELHSIIGKKFYCLKINLAYFSNFSSEDIRLKTQIADDEIIIQTIQAISSEENTRLEAFDMEIMALFFHLITYLIRNYKVNKIQKDNHDLIFQIIDYIGNNFNDALTTSHLAEQFHLSEQYFCNLFKKKTGLTPMNYINKFRAEKAAKLLKNTDLSITDISSYVGFNDPVYFSRIFKKYLNTSPRDYRKQL